MASSRLCSLLPRLSPQPPRSFQNRHQVPSSLDAKPSCGTPSHSAGLPSVFSGESTPDPALATLCDVLSNHLPLTHSPHPLWPMGCSWNTQGLCTCYSFHTESSPGHLDTFTACSLTSLGSLHKCHLIHEAPTTPSA